MENNGKGLKEKLWKIAVQNTGNKGEDIFLIARTSKYKVRNGLHKYIFQKWNPTTKKFEKPCCIAHVFILFSLNFKLCLLKG